MKVLYVKHFQFSEEHIYLKVCLLILLTLRRGKRIHRRNPCPNVSLSITTNYTKWTGIESVSLRRETGGVHLSHGVNYLKPEVYQNSILAVPISERKHLVTHLPTRRLILKLLTFPSQWQMLKLSTNVWLYLWNYSIYLLGVLTTNLSAFSPT
jgi:hypothetical protein